MTASPAETITAAVNRIGADTAAEFQVFEISLPPNRHYDLNHSSVGIAQLGIFHPTDDDLRALIAAAQAEIVRREAVAVARLEALIEARVANMAETVAPEARRARAAAEAGE